MTPNGRNAGRLFPDPEGKHGHGRSVKVYEKPSELLADLDSHGIYNAKMLEGCTFDYECIPLDTVDGFAAAIQARGLGGQVEGAEDDWLFAGYSAAEALADQYLPGQNPSGALQGRGSRFRACQEALKQAGF